MDQISLEKFTYLKDTWVVQGVLFSSDKFLILTEGTIYQYESERAYIKGANPEEIIGLKNYTVQNHKDNVLILENSKRGPLVYYSPRQDQVKVWHHQILLAQQNYDRFVSDYRLQPIIPFSEIAPIYSIDL